MIAAILLAAALALPSPQAVDLGSTRLYEQADAGACLTGLQFAVSAGTARQPVGQNGVAALAAEVLLRTKVDGVPLADRVTAAGGSIAVTIAPGAARFAVEALPEAIPGIARDLAAVLGRPDVSPAAVAAARAAIDARIADDERNPLAVALAMLRGALYAGSAGTPADGTSASLAQLGPAQVSAFLAAHYRRGNVIATAAGAVDTATADAVRIVLAALPEGAEPAADITLAALPPAAKRIITRRDISVPVLVAGFAAPALGERDFAAMLVVRALLGEISVRSAATTIAPFDRGVEVVYGYDVKPATFSVAVNGGRLDPAAGLAVLQQLVKRAAESPLDAEALGRLKAVARGNWQLEALGVVDRAQQLSIAVGAGLPADTAASVAGAVDRVSAADVQRVAKNYLQRYALALVLPRRGG